MLLARLLAIHAAISSSVIDDGIGQVSRAIAAVRSMLSPHAVHVGWIISSFILMYIDAVPAVIQRRRLVATNVLEEKFCFGAIVPSGQFQTLRWPSKGRLRMPLPLQLLVEGHVPGVLLTSEG